MKLPGIQIARGLAALCIVYFHSWVALARFPKDTAFPIYALANYGWIGVDIFFAISGFVICLVVSKPNFSPLPFLLNRAVRLYPLWLLTLTAFALLAFCWRSPTDTETVGYFLYSATLLPTEQFPFYNVGWSLQHEMLFYLSAALIVPLAGFGGLIGFLAASTIAFHTIEMPLILHNISMYHAEFLAGVLAFVFHQKIKTPSLAPALVAAGALGMAIVLPHFARGWLPIPLFVLMLGFANLQFGNWQRPFIHLGDVSYSLYLFHSIVFLIVSAVVSKLNPPIWTEEPIRAACFVVIVLISTISWKLFEAPIIGLGRRITAKLDNPAQTITA